jgi:hypothetical protein
LSFARGVAMTDTRFWFSAMMFSAASDLTETCEAQNARASESQRDGAWNEEGEGIPHCGQFSCQCDAQTHRGAELCLWIDWRGEDLSLSKLGGVYFFFLLCLLQSHIKINHVMSTLASKRGPMRVYQLLPRHLRRRTMSHNSYVVASKALRNRVGCLRIEETAE